MGKIKNLYCLVLELVTLLKKNKRAKMFLHQNVDLLMNGIYRINKSQTQIYEIGYKRFASFEAQYQYGSIKANNTKKQRILTLINHLLCKKSFKVQTKDKIFEGQLLCITTMNNNIKVFDTEKRKLISVYEDESFFNRLVDNRNYWSQYFRVPDYVVKRGKYNIIEEDILQKKNFNSCDILPLLIDDYIQYFNKVELSKDIIIDGDKLNKFCQLISINEEEFLSYLNSSEYRECVVHGDLWRSNIIYTGEKWFYIDFENVGTRVFYYDILLYIYIDWILGDESLMERFFNGELDNLFSSLYSGINMNYDPSKKRVMFITFLYFFYLEFWQGKNNVDNKLVELLSSI